MAKTSWATRSIGVGKIRVIKYIMAATTLRLFSVCTGTQKAYRFLGNVLGQRKRILAAFPYHYIDTAKHLLQLCDKHNVIEEDDRILELGTGWVHWAATVIRLFYDVRITLFDIWDNRQFAAFKHYFTQFQHVIDKEFNLEPAKREQVKSLLNSILETDTFDELYSRLGFQYVVDPGGTLKQFDNDSFAAIVSANVLEHIERSILSEFIRDTYRVLKPGGYSIHQIDLSDHLNRYDHSVSRKNYYRYSEKVWNRWFNNKVQYFNRIQRSEWKNLFSAAGLELLKEEPVLGEIGFINFDKSFASLSKQDKECMLLRLVYRKPLQK